MFRKISKEYAIGTLLTACSKITSWIEIFPCCVHLQPVCVLATGGINRHGVEHVC